MMIRLHHDLERSLEKAVSAGRFASLDEAMTEAASLLAQRLYQEQTPVKSLPATDDVLPPDPILGLMRDDAELMDEIVANAYRRKREDKWRDVDL